MKKNKAIIKKRLCVFVIYDRSCIIDKYISYMLKALKEVVSEIIVICNMPYVVKGGIFLNNADSIIFRNNVGLDVGAWKDALCDYIGWDELIKYDEIVLTNDSFYGPFYHFSEMFSFMDDIDADFWGITEHPGGAFHGDAMMNRHIQSYFTGIRRKMFTSRIFRDYWERLKYPSDIDDAISHHEIVFTEYFEKHGFFSTSYMKEKDIAVPYGICPFFGMNLEMIEKGRSPVLKKKSLRFFADEMPNCIGDSLKALQYIEKKGSYDTSLIWDNLYRLCGNGSFHPGFFYEEIDDFYKKCKRVFLYGAGNYGNRVSKYLNYRGYKISGVFDSYINAPDNNVSLFTSENLNSSDGIIITVGSKYYKDILSVLRKETTCQLLCAHYE